MSDVTENLRSKVALFPTEPGVYLMKDKEGRVIYVGKANNLRVRVRQYFSGHDSRHHVIFLMNQARDVDYLQTHTESEALLLENSLIKKHKPRYNLFLKDDKSYLCLKLTIQDDFPKLLTTRKIKKDGSLYYGPFTSADSLYQVKDFIDRHFLLRTCSDHEFAHRSRPCLEYQIKRCSAPCVQYVSHEDYAHQIESVRFFLEGKNRDLQKYLAKRMSEAVQKENFEEAARLRDLIAGMAAILEKQSVTRLSFDFVDIIALIRQEKRLGIAVLMVRDAMLIDSRYQIFDSLEEDEEFYHNFMTQYYSENAFIPKEILVPFDFTNKDVIENLLSQRSGHAVVLRKPKRGVVGARRDVPALLDMAYQNLTSRFQGVENQIAEVQKHLKNLKEFLSLKNAPHRMECFDVSHISGKNAVASLVTFVDGKKFSDSYRRFKIKFLDTPDDFAMMKQVLSRRFRKTEGAWGKPDLLVVDGGKGQLSQALAVLDEMQITDVDVIGLAKGKGPGARAKGQWEGKKEDEIYLPHRKNPVILKRGSRELMILQNLRDESHRFAIEYHHRLRLKEATLSWLDDIDGIGDSKKRALIRAFGSPQAVAEASAEALAKVRGVDENLARKIREFRLTVQK
jgi:excinuclease ABC subunit C